MPELPFAVISDLHANLEAVQAVLEDIVRTAVEPVVCLGDLVGYGPDPESVVDLVMKRCGAVIAGNHDWAVIHRPIGFNRLAAEVIEYTKDLMEPKLYQVFGHTRERWDFIENLPTTLREKGLVFVHGSLRDPLVDYVFGDRQPLWNPAQIDEIFAQFEGVCFCGHTHHPVVILDDKSCWYPSDKSTILPIDPKRKYIVNVGSVGQPRDMDPRACYALFAGTQVEYRRVRYDVGTTRRKIISIDALEDALGDRLLVGR